MFVLFWGIFITSSHTRRSQVRAVLGSLFCSFAQPRSRAVLGRSKNCWLIRSRAGREWAGGRQHWAVTPCDPLARCALKKPCSLCCLGWGMDCSTTPPWWVPLSIHSHSRVESELGKPPTSWNTLQWRCQLLMKWSSLKIGILKLFQLVLCSLLYHSSGGANYSSSMGGHCELTGIFAEHSQTSLRVLAHTLRL